ncbi:MAG: YihY/virulence factor BrkB family protein, partial [bacterium]|nr:YihY/virulence factor BrkB family protein [bacterium]
MKKFFEMTKYIINNYKKDLCHLHSLALTSITLISIVPFLAIAVSILKGTGYYKALKESGLNFLLLQVETHAGITAKKYVETIATNILTYIDNTNFTTLGFFGLLFLIYTAITLISTIEEALDTIWQTEKKPFSKRFIEYISSIVILPVFLITSSTLITLAEIKLGSIGILLSKLIPFLFIWCAISFINIYLPNVNISIKSGVIAGFITTVLWITTQIILFRFQIGITKYNAIYSTFAAVPIFIIWLNLSWNIILLGAEICKFLELGKEINKNLS